MGEEDARLFSLLDQIDHVDQIDRPRDQPLWLYKSGKLITLIMLITNLITSLDANLKSGSENASKIANLAMLAGVLKSLLRKVPTGVANAANNCRKTAFCFTFVH